MLSGSLAVAGALFELLGLGWLLWQPGSFALPIYLATHTAASLLAAAGMMLFVPQAREARPRAGFAYFAALAFFIPFVGVGAVLAIMVAVRITPRQRAPTKFRSVEVPRFNTVRAGDAVPFSRARVRPVLEAAQAPMELKLRALIALQGVTSRAGNELIRTQLGSSVDDVRLLAYGLLDAREKVFEARIHESKSRLSSATAPEERASLLRDIAHLYWELVYGGIVQGDLLLHAQEEARRHAEQALELDPDQGGTWMLLARVYLQGVDTKKARDALDRALACGYPRRQVLPYLAEAAYREREYRRVATLLDELSGTPQQQALAGVTAYWTGHEPAAR